MLRTSLLRRQAIQDDLHGAQAERTDQYTLWQILGIFALAAVPMALLTWVIGPAIIPYSPLNPGITFWLLMIVAMAWQCVVSLAILYHELGTLRWSAIRQRTWLQTPRDPGTDRPDRKQWWWVLPPLLIDAAIVYFLGKYLNAPMAWLFRDVQVASVMDIRQLASPEFRGAWWVLGVALLSIAFNYFLGEELLWHGVLLPKMRGVFGKYDWVANAVLFALYHLQKPWDLVSVVLTNMTYSWPASRYRSNWMAIVVHGSEGLGVLAMTLAVILGLVS